MKHQRIFFIALLFALPFAQLFAQNATEEYGTASYYGDEFHGRKTASGEKYNKSDLTCAHKTLPFGTKIRVTRLDTKNSVIVRVNDRGPFIKGYVVDLSRKAADAIDMLDDGVVKVKIEVVEKKSAQKDDTPEPSTGTTKPEERSTSKTEGSKGVKDLKPTQTTGPDREAPKTEKPAAKPVNNNKTAPAVAKPVTAKNFQDKGLYQLELKEPEKKGYGIQVSTLNNADRVFKEVAKLQGNWPDKVLVSIEPDKNDESKTAYKLIIGPFTDKKSAERNLKTASKKGYKKCFLVNLEE